MSDVAVALAFGVGIGFSVGVWVAIELHDNFECEQHDIGRCEGWADAHGLVAAWDAEGRCVLGAPATEGGE